MAKKKISSKKKRFSKASSQFKRALRKLNGCKTDKQKCDLIKNSSDAFIRDLACAIHKCLPIYKPILNSESLNSIRKFSNPKSGDKKRRNLIQHGGGGFVSMLKDIGHSISNVLSGHCRTCFRHDVVGIKPTNQGETRHQ